ncbi:ERVV2 protein, partial [Trogon melanurus]|nr:ERVV2 protein [Trogon melanurus]
TMKEGGVCAVINQSCCTYVDQSGRIEDDIENIWERTKSLHEITKDNTSWGFEELWHKLTSWLPNFTWLKQLLGFLVTMGLLVVLTCIVVQCSFWCCKQSTMDYENWK